MMTQQEKREPTGILADFAARLARRKNSLARLTAGSTRLYAASRLADGQIEAVIDAVNRLGDFGSVRELMTLLHASAGTRAMAAAE